MFGRITRDTNIGAEPVKTGEILELDENTFQHLKRAGAIEKCEPPADVEPKKPEPKFKKISPKQTAEKE